MKLSIVVPVYNCEKYISECLQSIISQSWSDWELLIVDDGSTDGTKGMIFSFVKGIADVSEQNRVRVIKLSTNYGPSYARTKGILEAQGEYIGFVDGDDWIDEGHYEGLLAAASETGADIICSDAVREGKASKPGVRVQSGSQSNLKSGSQSDMQSGSHYEILDRDKAKLSLFNRRSVYQYAVNKIYRTSILKELAKEGNLSEEKFIGEDFDLVTKAIDKSETIITLPQATYHYRVHRDSATQQGFTSERRLAYKKNQEYVDDFNGSDLQKQALKRYMMLEYMSFLLSMYRSKTRDRAIETQIINFVRENRKDYIQNTGDGFRAKAFAALLSPTTSSLFYRLWPSK